MTKDGPALFETGESDYGVNYHDHLLQQYKLYVEMADHVSSRRALSNTFFLTANTVVLSALGLSGLLSSDSVMELIERLVVLTGAIVFCSAWFFVLRSYDQLNTAKFQVIHDLEMRLPARLYFEEWEKLGKGKDPDKYRPLSHVEKAIPIGFIVMYAVLSGAWIIAAALQSRFIA